MEKFQGLGWIEDATREAEPLKTLSYDELMNKSNKTEIISKLSPKSDSEN